MRPLLFGEIRIDKVAEIDSLWFEAAWLYPGIEPHVLQRHAPLRDARLVEPVSQRLALSFHSYLIRAPGCCILVDTCNGNHKTRPPAMAWQHRLASDRYLTNLAALGLQPDDIDIVLCTHLHTDHVGWNTQLEGGRWVPTFKRARYLFSRREFEHWAALHAEGPPERAGHGAIADSVMPVLAAGQADLVDADHAVLTRLHERIWLEPSPGHTPGHVSVHVAAGGAAAVLSGDVIHHPVGIYEPALCSIGDLDRELAVRTRRRLLEYCAGSDALLLPAHFPSPTAARIHDGGGGRFGFAFDQAVA